MSVKTIDNGHRDPMTLVDRLRGIYRIPIDDGAGPLNGSMEHVSTYKTSPIHHDAADMIEQLLKDNTKLQKALVQEIADERKCESYYGSSQPCAHWDDEDCGCVLHAKDLVSYQNAD